MKEILIVAHAAKHSSFKIDAFEAWPSDISRVVDLIRKMEDYPKIERVEFYTDNTFQVIWKGSNETQLP